MQSQNSELKSELGKAQNKISHLEEQVNELQTKVEQFQDKVSPEEKNIRNILLIGRTGKGKSTLANVLSNTQEFAKGKYGISETRSVQAKEFQANNIKY